LLNSLQEDVSMSKQSVIMNVVEELAPQSHAAQRTPDAAPAREQELTAEIERLESRIAELNRQIYAAQKEKRKAHDNLVSGSGSAEDAGIEREKFNALTAAASEVKKQLDSQRMQLATLQSAQRRNMQLNQAAKVARSLIDADAALKKELAAQADALLAGLQRLGQLKADVSDRKRDVLQLLGELVPDVEALRWEDKMHGRGARIRVEFANLLDELSSRDADLKTQGFNDWNYVPADYASIFIMPNLSREEGLLWGMVHDVRQRVLVLEKGAACAALLENDTVFVGGQRLQVVKPS
jgi:hypothetical protein